MNMNAVSDAVLAVLTPLHSRIYRNKPPTTPTFPYCVYFLDSAVYVSPSNDIYLEIQIFEDPNTSVRAIETLADTIQNTLDNKVIINSTLNIHLALEQRQYVSNNDLTTSQMVSLRFVVRSYFK